MLPFLFKDFLLFSGRVESRDNICIIEHHLIDRNHTCMYLAKFHLSTAYVLRDRPPPITFLFTESLGTHALIYLRTWHGSSTTFEADLGALTHINLKCSCRVRQTISNKTKLYSIFFCWHLLKAWKKLSNFFKFQTMSILAICCNRRQEAVSMLEYSLKQHIWTIIVIFAREGGWGVGGILPYISHIGICRSKVLCFCLFVSFWSENGYDFRGNYASV